MKLVVLADNRKIDDKLEAEHGLSIYVETDEYKYLLDTGASDAFIRNAEKLNVDLKQVDTVFISHGHADHIGGLEAFLQINTTAKVILSKHALSQKLYSKRLGLRNISIELDQKKYQNEFIFVDEDVQLTDELSIYSANQNQFPWPKGNKTLFKDAENGMVPDDFDHELIACIGKESLLIFVGCGHKGLMNILETVSEKTTQLVRYVVGGFHLLDSTETASYESEAEIEKLGDELNNKYKQAEFITGHCTGEKSYQVLKRKLEFRLIHFFTGYKLREY